MLTSGGGGEAEEGGVEKEIPEEERREERGGTMGEVVRRSIGPTVEAEEALRWKRKSIREPPEERGEMVSWMLDLTLLVHSCGIRTDRRPASKFALRAAISAGERGLLVSRSGRPA